MSGLEITTRWSQRVTERCNALDLEEGVFTLERAKEELRALSGRPRQTR